MLIGTCPGLMLIIFQRFSMVEVQTAGSRLVAASSAETTGTAAGESAGPESAYKL